MANELIKAAFKLGAAVIAVAFGGHVAKEGKKNVDDWRNSRNQIQQKSNKK